MIDTADGNSIIVVSRIGSICVAHGERENIVRAVRNDFLLVVPLWMQGVLAEKCREG